MCSAFHGDIYQEVVFESCQRVVTLGFFHFIYSFCRSLRHFWTLQPKGSRTTCLFNCTTAHMYNSVIDRDARGTSYKPSTFTSLSFTTREKSVRNSMSFNE
jgi:hypothetical protein